ncbi:MAG: right-handed parallel beta-helix repeat-containing protein [Bacteroidales bacterium]|nr:right-handed parallel beta-helix repeat-containing protein [Bacteroidales bacterium]MCF8458785.1 right-handed parallel beta-helix repeat-containing protein [Bacteroidales bacterium]
MRRIYFRIALFAVTCFYFSAAWSQTYILNEDFSSTVDTIPPAQWINLSTTSTASDIWHFNNPGNRQMNYPITGQFAIFDSQNYSQNGLADESILESPFIDASVGIHLFLLFDHYFSGHSGDTAFVEVYNGVKWKLVAFFTDSTQNPAGEMFNLSALAGGVSNTKIRFRWKGNSDHFWAIDNISVFVPLVLDMGILSVASPQMPFVAGLENIELNLKNFGATNISSATIHWQLNGVTQSPFAWTGNLSFSDTAANVVIGSHNFIAGQPVQLKAWVKNPNGTFDPNSLNDTLTVTLAASLCGTYTIGGVAPDFLNFTEAATVLNNAGVSCPVVFLIRDGTYHEQIEIVSIPGASNINTITFRGESLDSTAAILDYTASNTILNYALLLNGTSWLRFEYLSFQRNGTSNASIVKLVNDVHDVEFVSCQLKGNRYGMYVTAGAQKISVVDCSFPGYLGYGVYIMGNSTNIYETGNFVIQNSYFSVQYQALYLRYCSAIIFSGNKMEGDTDYGNYIENNSNIIIENNTFINIDKGLYLHTNDSIEIYNNYLDTLDGYGLYMYGTSFYADISSNKFLNINNANGVEIRSANTKFYNNFIHVKGIAAICGIFTDHYAGGSQILFNSVNLTSTNAQSASINIANANNLQVKNNIFANNDQGYAVTMPSMPTGLQLDYNEYYTSSSQLAQYGTTDCAQLSNWQTATLKDANSVEVNPFYSSDIDLTCNQILVDNEGLAGTIITVDIDSVLRSLTPDIGAREFSPCSVDAGINDLTGLTNPMAAGLQNIQVILQNQGTTSLTSATIHWTVNGILQTSYNWSGNLISAQNEIVLIGTYDFQPGSNYNIKVWTSSPNSQIDCNHYNDTSILYDLATPLCGTYTIGGTSPDFLDFEEAITVLNNAGVSCPVVFLVRDGVYYEQIEIVSVPGADSINTVTFRGESLDSTVAILDYIETNTILNYTLLLNGAAWLRFEYMSLQRNGSDNASIVRMDNDAHDINFVSCQIKGNRNGINASYGAQNIAVLNCSFPGFVGYGIYINGNSSNIYHTRNFLIQGNYFKAQYQSMYLRYCSGVLFSENKMDGGTDYGNYIEFCSNIIIENNSFTDIDRGIYLSYTDSVDFRHNYLDTINGYGLSTNGPSSYCNIRGNMFLNINNANGVEIKTPNTSLSNNFIHVKGIAAISGIYTDYYADNSKIFFNSININNTNAQSSAIKIANADNLRIKNNIFCNNGVGYAVKMPVFPLGLQLDYNNYFTTGNLLAQFGNTNFSQLSAWQSGIALDTNSVEANPFFVSDVDLTCNQILANNTALAGTIIPIDIDSTLRSLTPDLGAREFSPCAVDAGINKLTGLTNPMASGIQNIHVILQNQGASTLTTSTIHWTVNGTSQASYSWTGNLASAQNDTVVIGTYDFQSGNSYLIKAWAESPNGLADCNNYNDTSVVNDLSVPLCGTYTIGGTSPDFLNFTEAVTVLNNAGVSCPVVFLVRDGTYNEQIEIISVLGADSINTVTFRGESLDSTTAILDYTTSNTILNYTLLLNGPSWLRFEYLSLQRNGSGNASIVQLDNDAHHIKFNSCQIKGNRYGIKASDGVQKIDVLNCSFPSYVGYGISIQGNSTNIYNTGKFVIHDCYFSAQSQALYARDCSGILFSDNKINGGTEWGNYIEYCSNINIENNNFTNIGKGIYLYYNDSVEINNNYLDTIAGYGLSTYGIVSFCNVRNNRFLNINNANGVEIRTVNTAFYNNFIHVKGIAAASGIFTSQLADDSKILFNSINITNTNAQSLAINIANADNLRIKNNILTNSGGGFVVKMTTIPVGLQLDYNDYFTSGSQLAQYGSTNLAQLSGWQAATSMDANSLNYNPFYMTTTELRPFQRELNGAGIPIVGILLDIDGQIRDENAPDIGADEFMVDYGITALLYPDLYCDHTSNEPVTISMKQFGDTPFNNFQVSYQVNGGTIYTEIVPGSINNDIIFTFSQTQDLSVYGTYIFKFWIVNSYDDNINNDTLIVERYSNPVPQITMSQTMGCTGTPIEFTANATVDLGTIGSYFWDFGDGTTSLLQNPSHQYNTAGTYTISLYAYSGLGCYNDTSFQTIVLASPHAEFFTSGNVCLGDTVFFSNLSTVSSGTLSYLWDFDNNDLSIASDPYYLYTTSDTFNVILAALAQNGCADSMNMQVVVYPLPDLAFLNLPATFCSNDTALLLALQPPGATVVSSAYSGGWYYPSLASLGSNTISMSFIDNHGCSDSLFASVDLLHVPTASISGLASQYCNSGEDPTISGFPVGGSFLGPGISNNQFSIANAGIGTHSISYTYTEANGCTDVAEQAVEVAQLNTMGLSFLVDSISCFGYSNGGIDLQVSFTVQNYSTISWSNGASTEDINGLGAGMYTVTLGDNLGCFFTDSVFLINPDTFIALENIQPVSCFGGNDGTVSLSVLGGLSPYSFEWSNVATGADLQNLLSGYYNYTLTDVLNCEVANTVYVSQPAAPLNISPVITDVDCYGNSSGSISTAFSGGTSPYSIVGWSNGGTGNPLSNIPAGYYTVTVSDANACLETMSLTVNQPSAVLSVQLVGTDIACYGDQTGSVNTSIAGGTAPYQNIIWSNGATEANINSLPTGTYYVTVHDQNNCEDTASVIISEAPNISVSFTETHLLCYGNSDGSILTTVSGATPPYSSFLWSSGQSTQDIANIPAGNFELTITDANNCEFINSTSITQPNDMLFDFSLVEPNCYGESNGEIDLSVSGATPPYGNIIWSNSTSVEDLVAIPSGQYTVSVTDSLNCNFVGNVDLGQPDSISLLFGVEDVRCYGENNGSIDLSITGGVSPYSIVEWSNGTSTEDISGLGVGTYQITVSDQHNCIQYGNVDVGQPDALTFSSIENHVLCFGESSGSIEITPEGGTLPYHYVWEDSSSGEMIENLSAGDYAVSIYDINNCEAKATISIHSPPDLIVVDSIKITTCIFAEDASISVDVSGGVSPYSYTWSTLEYSATVSDLAPGVYNLMVGDSNLCQKDYIFTIPFSELPCLEIPNVFSPNDDGINDNWVIKGMEYVPTCELKVLDRWGRTVFESIGYPIPWDGKYDNKPLQSDAYFYFIQYNNGAEPLTGKVSIVY